MLFNDFTSHVKKICLLKLCAFACLVCVILLTASHVSADQANNTIDSVVIRAERLDQRLADINAMVENSVAIEAAGTKLDVAKTKPLMLKAISQKFDLLQMKRTIVAAIEQPDNDYQNFKALDKAVSALIVSYAQIDKIYTDKDEVAGKSIQARLGNPKTRETVNDVANLMASPKLAADAASFQQAVGVALKISSDPGIYELNEEDQKKFLADLPNFLANLREREVNQSAYSRVITEEYARNELSYALATLSDDQLDTLKMFYSSPTGIAKTEALKKTYKDILSENTSIALDQYFRLIFAEGVKN
ncbi:hypothetical protein [Agrobacterium larrymoorei]|uniref:DUF2059 domain-containing protein n=1 Tax=Agrobacterium larrymoorei TaxID=160699 RepID=A0A4D7DRH9_9HYPH|nr:hypothetical protein [Agrobacterium larrymoorei]QCI99391.1 hypothetical protein CFBP5473_15355 [Agrobacterium larrymoorei]QYA08933.1 hypothetical protein J5285_16100 [Agrobacterium larrymoorei]